MKEFNEIQAELSVPKVLENFCGEYMYRNAEKILEALKPLLNKSKCIFTINDDIALIGGRCYIKATAIIRNERGETETTAAFVRETSSKKSMDEVQIIDSVSSYARKYALNGLFCTDDTKNPDTLNTSAEYTQPT